MSETTSLTELAQFAGRSTLSTEDAEARRRAMNSITGGIKVQGRRSVAELLGLVLVLSARTRRAVLPTVAIDLDVFSPDGGRAVRLILPR